MQLVVRWTLLGLRTLRGLWILLLVGGGCEVRWVFCIGDLSRGVGSCRVWFISGFIFRGVSIRWRTSRIQRSVCGGRTFYGTLSLIPSIRSIVRRLDVRGLSLNRGLSRVCSISLTCGRCCRRARTFAWASGSLLGAVGWNRVRVVFWFRLVALTCVLRRGVVGCGRWTGRSFGRVWAGGCFQVGSFCDLEFLSGRGIAGTAWVCCFLLSWRCGRRWVWRLLGAWVVFV